MPAPTAPRHPTPKMLDGVHPSILPGESKREAYAAQALHGIMANGTGPTATSILKTSDKTAWFAAAADDAVKAADALLARLAA